MPLQSQPVSSAPPSNTPPTSRLPDYHVLGSLTDVKPGTIPLLVRMPDGNCEQLDVPLHSTVDDIASSLQKDSNDVFRLSFGNSDLDPAANLVDTNIVDAYEHAGSLLHVIASGRQDADTKAAALDSACAVVETISNGIKDMEALCAAAMPEPTDQSDQSDQSDQPDQPDQPGQPPSPGPHPEHASQIDRSEFKQYPNSSGATPSQLAYNLSRRLPSLFPPSGTAAVFPQEETEQPALGRQVTVQPSLSSIRDARRRYSALRKAQEEEDASKGPARVPDIAIGESTNIPLSFDLEHPPEPQHREGGSSLLLANSGKTTWLEDVMKTWEVDAVRESGVLEKSKDGQEISNYLQSLEDEAERELQIEKIDTDKHASSHPTSSAPGDSSDDQDENAEQQGDTNQNPSAQNAAVPNGQPTRPNGHANNKGENAAEELHESIAAVNISDRSRSNAASQMLMAQNAASVAVMEGTTGPNHLTKEASHASQPSTNHPQQQPSQNSFQPGAQRHQLLHPQHPPGQSQQTQPIPNQAQQTPPLRPSLHIPPQANIPVPAKAPRSGTPSSSSNHKTENSSSSTRDSKSKSLVRQATKIAPAPNLANSPLGAANGLFTNQMYHGVVPVPGVAWAPKPAVTGKKKRGRKRKNPELTDEERALARKEQNRESAKLSRVRRKVIAAEYEGRLNALVEENTMLRKQVEGLNNRLVYLQSLLTISVRQEPPPS